MRLACSLSSALTLSSLTPFLWRDAERTRERASECERSGEKVLQKKILDSSDSGEESQTHPRCDSESDFDAAKSATSGQRQVNIQTELCYSHTHTLAHLLLCTKHYVLMGRFLSLSEFIMHADRTRQGFSRLVFLISLKWCLSQQHILQMSSLIRHLEVFVQQIIVHLDTKAPVQNSHKV